MELQGAYGSLERLCESFTYEDAGGDGKETFEEKVQNLLRMMKARLESPQIWPPAHNGGLPRLSAQSLPFSGWVPRA